VGSRSGSERADGRGSWKGERGEGRTKRNAEIEHEALAHHLPHLSASPLHLASHSRRYRRGSRGGAGCVEEETYADDWLHHLWGLDVEERRLVKAG